MPIQTLVQVRRGTLAQWNAAAAALGAGILYQGEIGYETDTGKFKIGDGTTAWASLDYASVLANNFVAGSGISLTKGSNGSTLTISLSDPTIQVSDITDFAEGVDDRVAQLLVAGSGISLSYNDASNALTISNIFSNTDTEAVQDIIGSSLVGGSGINVSYNDSTGYTTISSSGTTSHTHTLADITDVTSSATEVNYLDLSTGPGTAEASKAIVLDSSKNITGIGNISAVDLTLSGNLVVSGTTTTINSTTITIDDKNLELGSVASPSDAGADGGGITLKGTTDKEFKWVDATDSWTSSEHIDLATGKVLKIAGTQVLSASQYVGNAATVTNGVYTTDTGTVTNTMLKNSSVTIGSSSVSLGSTLATITGLTSVTSTSFVGALTGNASTATKLETARTINGATFDGTANITIASIDGGSP